MFDKQEITPGIISTLCSNLQPYHSIPPEKFVRYSVKRGLRNADGTGVLAGITRLSNVHGYLIDEGERRPIEGRLSYRGINLYDLLDGFEAEGRFGFCETAFLLISGKLPSSAELTKFGQAIGECRELPLGFTEDVIMRAPSPNIMNKLAESTLALYGYDSTPDNISPENIMRQSVELISRFPVIISHAYQAKRRYFDGDAMYLRNPNPALSTAENILHLIRPNGEYSDADAKLLDRCLVIHAEHGGGNNSAFATRVAASSGTDTYSAIAAAVGALKGPRHGGANQKVCQMFDDIKQGVSDWGNEGEVAEYLRKILRKEANDGSGLIYGMGHAVYTLSDPRAVALKNAARPLAATHNKLDEFCLIETVERLTPQVMAEVRGEEPRAICANVDLYSGLVYEMLGIPREMFTPLFAAARITGWLAHRMEEVTTGGKIIRPAYKPIIKDVAYIPIHARGNA